MEIQRILIHINKFSVKVLHIKNGNKYDLFLNDVIVIV